MRRILALSASIIALLLAGCTAPLVPVQYKGDVTRRSDIPASVRMETGRVTGYSSVAPVYLGSGVTVPMAMGPAPKLHFGESDQQVFMDSLRSELSRHKLVKLLIDGDADATKLDIEVVFALTEHYPDFQEYRIIALLGLRYGEISEEKKYDILSSEGQNLWAKLNTNASKGKKLAAEKLMQAMIPDIEAFVSKINTPPSSPPNPES